jgi:hypothetical protein
MREVTRTALFWIDTLDLAYYTAADGNGQTKAALEARLDVGGEPGSAAQRCPPVLHD